MACCTSSIDRTGSQDKQLFGSSLSLGAAPGLAPCGPCSRAHTCANIRPPAGKTAPLCPAWHRCPGLAVSCSPGLAAAGPAWPLFPRAQCPRCPAPGRRPPFAAVAPLQLFRRAEQAGLQFGLCPWQVLDKQSGHANGTAREGLQGQAALPLRGIAAGHQDSEPSPHPEAPHLGRMAQGLPAGCAAIGDWHSKACWPGRLPSMGTQHHTRPAPLAGRGRQTLWLGVWAVGRALSCASSAEPGVGAGWGKPARTTCGPTGQAAGAPGVAPAPSAPGLAG